MFVLVVLYQPFQFLNWRELLQAATGAGLFLPNIKMGSKFHIYNLATGYVQLTS